jgi:molybdopterin converting factor small subunit
VAVKVTVRYFAAARAAAGFDDEIIRVAAGTTVAQTLPNHGDRDTKIEKV